MNYVWSEHSLPIPAQQVGETLERILQTEGVITARRVVEEARPEDSPLHPIFEWDDSVAAEDFRRNQARNLVRSLRVVIKQDHTETPKEILAFVRVHQVRGGGYIPTVKAMSEPDSRQQVLTDALRSLQAWRRRYDHLRELETIFAVVDRLALTEEAPQSA